MLIMFVNRHIFSHQIDMEQHKIVWGYVSGNLEKLIDDSFI